MLNKGAIVNALDRDSISPLILAASSGNLDTVKILIKYGANVNQTDRMNSSALHYACMRVHAEIARELIENGCISNTNMPYSYSSPLKYLVVDKQYSVAKCLVESGCDLSSEKWIFDSKFIIDNKIDDEFARWLKVYVKRPPSLMNLCRQKIRISLGDSNLSVKIDSLNIPKFLKEYLKVKF